MDYDLITAQVKEYLVSEPWYTAALSNISALLMETLPDINWAGFYLMRGGQLVVGPFQGRPACIHIAPGRGVCGKCAAEDKTVVVDNVHEFPGHIACDSASNAEMVVPIHRDGTVTGVLDIDSPVFCRFTEEDRKGIERVARLIEADVSWEA